MRLTDEQQGVVESRADSVVVNAFAGTGKTSTLVAYAKARPRQKMLYIAFNKSVAEDAKARFPDHVDARTSHSLAYSAVGWKYRDKLGNVKPLHAQKFLNLQGVPEHEATLIATMALGMVQKFCASSEARLVSSLWDGRIPSSVSFGEDEVVKAARRIWHGMCDPHEASMPMPHDGYLKLWQLDGADLSKYDTVLLDEAQDTNPCLHAIYECFDGRKVLVGDTHQNIYSFRGAMNAMKATRGEKHALTASFRFGPSIAHVANALLSTFKGEVLALQGYGESDPANRHVQNIPTAILLRTNAGLFDTAAELMKTHAKTMGFVGGFKSYNPDQIMDTFYLMMGQPRFIKDPFIKGFNRYDDFVGYAELTDDKEIKSRIRVVEKYEKAIPSIMEKLWAIDEQAAQEGRKPFVALTTAHRSKGLEWPQVILGHDFGALMEKGRPLTPFWMPEDSKSTPLPEEEANLMYVAATRARTHLVMNDPLEEFMQWVDKQAQKSPLQRSSSTFGM